MNPVFMTAIDQANGPRLLTITAARNSSSSNNHTLIRITRRPTVGTSIRHYSLPFSKIAPTLGLPLIFQGSKISFLKFCVTYKACFVYWWANNAPAAHHCISLLLSLPGCQLPDCHPLSYQLPTRPPPSPPLRQLPWVCTFQNSKVDWAEREENLYIAFNLEFFFLSASGGLFGGQVGALTGSLGLPSPTSTNQHGQPAQSKYGQVGPKKTRVPIYGAGLFVPFIFNFFFSPRSCWASSRIWEKTFDRRTPAANPPPNDSKEESFTPGFSCGNASWKLRGLPDHKPHEWRITFIGRKKNSFFSWTHVLALFDLRNSVSSTA